MMRAIRDRLKRPGGRMVMGGGATVAVALVLALVAFGVYVYVYVYGGDGGAGGDTGASTVATATLKPSPGQTVFTIDPSVSSASFEIHEVLFGNPNTVLGKTSQVSGQILINTTDPSKSQLGPIHVDLSALTTDSDMRNRTLQNRILETGDPANRYATFTATSFQGLPSTFPGGQLVRFKVTGNLTVHQVTKIETFDVLFTANSGKQVTGTANTTVRYEDFNLAIPDVPSVTDVSDTVVLTLNFTARAA